MKISLPMVALAALMLQAPISILNAQVIPVIPGKGSFVGTAGDYNISQEISNIGNVAQTVLKNTKEIQQADKDFLIGTVRQLNDRILELAKLRKSFGDLSNEASLRQVKIERYLTLVNDIKSMSDIIQAEIQTKTLINRETLPSYSPAEAGKIQATINNYGNINMAPVMERVENVRAQLMLAMNEMQFKNLISSSNDEGIVQQISVTENALDSASHLKGIKVLSSRQIEDYNVKIAEKLTPSTNTAAYQRRSVELTVNLMKQVAFTYGKGEWLRFQNSNDSKALVEVMKGIQDAFFRRSYLRRKYNFRMGAIQPADYKKLPINLEDFGSQPLKMAITQFRAQAANSQEEINKAFENARNFLELYDKKATPVFASRSEILAKKSGVDYLSQNTNVLIRMNSAITYLTGQRKTAEILRDLMILVLSDIMEEKKLIEQDSMEMVSIHDTKYRATEEARSEYNRRVCQIDFTLSAVSHSNVCVPLGVKIKAQPARMMGGTSSAEIFTGLVNQYNNVERARLQEARMLQELVDAANEAGMTDQERSERQMIEDDIFGSTPVTKKPPVKKPN